MTTKGNNSILMTTKTKMMTTTKRTTSVFTSSLLTKTMTIFSTWTLTLRKNSGPAFQRTRTAANSELRGGTRGLM